MDNINTQRKSRVVLLNAKGHEPTRKGAERSRRIYFFTINRPGSQAGGFNDEKEMGSTLFRDGGC